MKDNRRASLEAYIGQRKEVSMKELQYAFPVSMNTLRSDIQYLERAGIVKKTYGGVFDCRSIKSFSERQEESISRKFLIAEKAASFIESGDTVYLDYGTTTMHITDLLENKDDITILTPNMHIIQNCIKKNNINLIILPGEFDDSAFGVMSDNTYKDLLNYNIGKAFMSCSGILADGGICVARHIQKLIKETVMKRSSMHYLLAESHKCKLIQPLCYSNLAQFDALITDKDFEDASNICELSHTVCCLV